MLPYLSLLEQSFMELDRVIEPFLQEEHVALLYQVS